MSSGGWVKVEHILEIVQLELNDQIEADNRRTERQWGHNKGPKIPPFSLAELYAVMVFVFHRDARAHRDLYTLPQQDLEARIDASSERWNKLPKTRVEFMAAARERPPARGRVQMGQRLQRYGRSPGDRLGDAAVHAECDVVGDQV